MMYGNRGLQGIILGLILGLVLLLIGTEISMDEALAQTTDTVAGRGCYGGDGGPAINARLSQALKMAIDSNGDIYISDTNNHRVRKITASTGIITTVAGTGVPGFSGDGGLATSAQLNAPAGLALDMSGNLYIADRDNNRIRRVGLSTGIITTLSGTEFLSSPVDVYFLATTGDLYITDSGNGQIRRVDTLGLITTAVSNLSFPAGITIDTITGDLYIAHDSEVIKVTPGGDGVVNGGPGETVTVVAGGGSSTAEGVQATSAQLSGPFAVALSAGRLYIADTFFFRTRMVVPGDNPGFTGEPSEIITTVAGIGVGGFIQDGVEPTTTWIHAPVDIKFDSQGRFNFLDSSSLLRRIDPGGNGVVDGNPTDGESPGETINKLIAGCFSGDGGPATSADLDIPTGIIVDGMGNLYIGDQFNHRIRRVDPSGNISTVAGNGGQTHEPASPPEDQDFHISGDPGPGDGTPPDPPTGIRVSHAFDFALDSAGNLYFVTGFDGRIRKVTPGGDGVVDGDLDESVVTLLAPGYNVDGIAVDPTGNHIYVSRPAHCKVYKLISSTLVPVAGTGGPFSGCGFGGDGGPATSAQLNQPSGIVLDADGNLYIADQYNHRVRRVTSGTDGVVNGGPGEIISTVAGNGTAGSGGDGGPATSGELNTPSTVRLDAAGNLYIADWLNYKVRKVVPGADGMVDGDSDDIISTFAGTGARDFCGDGGPATSACFNFLSTAGNAPARLAVDPSGNVYITDVANNRIRKVNASLVDSDSDGLPDSWETQYGLDPNDATGNNGASGDPDGDAFTNYEEYLHGSIPTNATSTPALDVWSPLGPPDPEAISSLATDSQNIGTLYAGSFGDSSGGDVYKTTDGGVIWTSSQPIPGLTNVSSLAIDPSNPNIIYAGHNCAGVSKSVDGGQTWTLVNNGLCVMSLAIDRVAPDTVYAAGYVWVGGNKFEPRVSRSIDGGNNWTDSSSGLPGPGVEEAGLAWSIVIHPENRDILYAGTGQGLFWSTDGAATWAARGLAGLLVNPLVFNPYNPNVLYAGTSQGVYKSSDGGVTWVAKTSGIFAQPVLSLAINPQYPSILYAGTWHTVYRSTNDGESWSIFGTGLPDGAVFSLAIDPQSPRTLYAGTDGGDVDFPSRTGIYIIITSIPDMDGDGLPDSWEIQYGLNPTDPNGINGTNGDPDGDGFTNLQEYQAGTNPTNWNSKPWYDYRSSSYMISITSANGGGRTISSSNYQLTPGIAGQGVTGSGQSLSYRIEAGFSAQVSVQ